MQFKPHLNFAALAFALVAMTPAALPQSARMPIQPPPMPFNLQAPAGHTPYLKTRAIGTQNHLCFLGPEGYFWKFLGPQATLSVHLPWFQGEATWQVATHFLGANPAEEGAQRPAWQSSSDTSAVWANAIANSADPAFVAPGAIPWLLLQVTGAQRGPSGGTALTQTTYIQRLNTSGGVAPTAACDASTLGTLALVPYTTDYYFYQATNKR